MVFYSILLGIWLLLSKGLIKMGIPIPKSFQKYLLFVAATQRMENITPLELFTCITAFIGGTKGMDCLDDNSQNMLRAYFKRWNLVDFTVKEEDHVAG